MLIFRNKPPWSQLITGIVILAIAAYAFQKKLDPIKDNMSPGGKLFLTCLVSMTGAFLIGQFFYNRYQKDKPIIILDGEGIWYEVWGKQLLWRDIDQIEHFKIKHRNTIKGGPLRRGAYTGFHWEIRLHTEEKEWCIDERSTQIWNRFLVARFNDPFENEGGELGKLISECYEKNQEKNVSYQPILSSQLIVAKQPTVSCCVCMESFSSSVCRIFLDPCGHDICNLCAIEWFLPNNIPDRTRLCPHCKNSIDFDSLFDYLGL